MKYMRKNTITTSNIIWLISFVVLAVWLSPFILIGVFVYLGYFFIYKPIMKRKILQRIKNEWFPKGKYGFFFYSSSRKWRKYFEQNLISKIQSKAIICNRSTRYEHGWKNNSLEAKVLRFFLPSGYSCPVAIVFLPSGAIKIFQFYAPYIKMLKSQNQNQDYKNLEKDFLDLLDSL